MAANNMGKVEIKEDHSSSFTRRTKAFLGVFLLSMTVGLMFQGSRGLYETTEGRYALCAREMLRSGNWLEPMLLGQSHWTKPPLTYWFIAGGLRLFGVNEWGARVPEALAFALTATLVGLLARRMWNDDRTGFYAGLVYATSLYPVAVGFTVNTDTFLALFETAAILCYWMALRGMGKHRLNWSLGLWFALALGFATKGPPALMALIPMVAWGTLQRDERGNKGGRRILLNPFGWAIFLLVGCGWYLLEIARHHELLGYFLGDEVVARVATDKFGRNPEWYKPFIMYLPIMLLGGGFWSVFPFLAAWKNRVWTSGFWHRVTTDKNRVWLFLLVWLLLPLLIFSLSRSRLPNYLLPIFPAVAIGVGRWLARSEALNILRRQTIYVLGAASFVLCVGGKAFFAYGDESSKDMGAVARLCEPYDEPGHSLFVLYDRDEDYGFDFYAKNPVIRVFPVTCDAVDKPPAMESVFNAFDCPTLHKNLYIVCRRRHNLEQVLLDDINQNKIEYDIVAIAPDWLVVRVDANAVRENNRRM